MKSRSNADLAANHSESRRLQTLSGIVQFSGLRDSNNNDKANLPVVRPQKRVNGADVQLRGVTCRARCR